MGIAIGIGISPVLVQLASLVNQPPRTDLISARYGDSILGMEIIDVSGSKYFKAKTGSDLLITNYDFDSAGIPNFRHKSKATIDVFGVTGLYAVQMFQNFNHGNQYFCKHKARVLDSNGVELFDASVLQIVEYSTPLTGDDLVKANLYFGVPEKVTAKYVDFTNGVDTNAGTEALPWKTLAKIQASITSNETVYIKNSTFTLSDFYFSNAATNVKLQAIGQVSIAEGSSSTYTFMLAGSYSWTLTGFLFDGKGAAPNLLRGNSASNATLSKCVFRNEGTYLAATANNNVRNTFLNCVFIARSTNTGANIAGTFLNFNYCHFVDVYHNNSIDGATFTGCKFVNNTDKKCFDSSHTLIFRACNFDYKTGAIENIAGCDIQYCNFTPQSTGKFAITSTAGTGEWVIKNNYFTNSNITITGDWSFINLNDVKSWDIQNNSFVSVCQRIFYHCLVINNTAQVGRTGKINYNYSKSNSINGSSISTNLERTASDVNDGCEFIGNRIIGQRIDFPALGSGNHLLFANGGKNMIIKYNKISHGCRGIVIKNGTTGTAYTENGCMYNIIEDCTTGIAVGSAAGVMNGLNVFNNTIKHSNLVYDGTQPMGLYFLQSANHVIAKNNIIHIDQAVGTLVNINETTPAVGNIVENSQLYGGQYLMSDNGTNCSDLATANAAGKLLNCVVGDALLSSSLVPAVPIIGVDLGEGYKTGLGALSAWKSPTTDSALVIVDQHSGAWQKGAIIQ